MQKMSHRALVLQNLLPSAAPHQKSLANGLRAECGSIATTAGGLTKRLETSHRKKSTIRDHPRRARSMRRKTRRHELHSPSRAKFWLPPLHAAQATALRSVACAASNVTAGSASPRTGHPASSGASKASDPSYSALSVIICGSSPFQAGTRLKTGLRSSTDWLQDFHRWGPG